MTSITININLIVNNTTDEYSVVPSKGNIQCEEHETVLRLGTYICSEENIPEIVADQ